MKQLTGGEPVTARFLFGEEFEFYPSVKILLAFNHKPEIKDQGPAMWRRVRLVPFPVAIAESEQVKGFGATLEPELPGILAWAVRGCLIWQQQGLPTPPAVDAATRQYRAESDDLAPFIAERCQLDSGLRVGATTLYQAFRAWAANSGVPAISQKEFGTQLGEREGLIRVKSRAGIIWHGISLVNDVNGGEGSPGVFTHARAREEGIRNAVNNRAHGAPELPEELEERLAIQAEGAA
jgi:putative DNA primase/helicase